MNILVLTNLYPPHYIGGYELICQTVVEGLRARGHAISILTSDYGLGAAGASAPESGIERTLKINGLYGHPWLPLRKLRWVEKHNNQALRRTMASVCPDLVYIWNMGGLSKSMLFTLQELGIPRVFYISDHWIIRGLRADVWLNWWNRPDSTLPRRLARHACECAGLRQRWQLLAPTNPASHLRFPRIYFCSRALRDLTAQAGYDVGHGAIIYAPIHERFLHAERRSPPTSLSRLLYVGRLAEDKGVMTTLRALALLRERFNGRLSIYGRGDADYVNQLQRFAHEQRLEVTFSTATADQMPDIYRQHDALLFPSEWAEPFALTPIEAMACGLPVIGTTTGGSAELFRDGENALTYTAGHAGQLAERIWELASDHRLRQRCADNGFTEARARCAAPVILGQVEQYLSESLTRWPGYPARIATEKPPLKSVASCVS